MQQRLVLLLVIALGLAAAAAVIPVPEEGAENRSTTEAPEPGGPSLRGLFEDDDPVEVALNADAGPQGPERTETVPADRHVIVTVRAREPGQVELRELGRIETLGPQGTVVFDLFTDRTGHFPVVYTPVEGPRRRIATLVVEEAAGGAQA